MRKSFSFDKVRSDIVLSLNNIIHRLNVIESQVSSIMSSGGGPTENYVTTIQFNNYVNSLNSTISSIDSNLNGLNSLYSNVANQLTNHSSSISTITNSLASLELTVASLEQQIDNLETTLSNLNLNDISNFISTVEFELFQSSRPSVTIKTRLESLEFDVTQIKEGDIPNINNSISDINTTLDDVQTTTDELKNLCLEPPAILRTPSTYANINSTHFPCDGSYISSDTNLFGYIGHAFDDMCITHLNLIIPETYVYIGNGQPWYVQSQFRSFINSFMNNIFNVSEINKEFILKVPNVFTNDADEIPSDLTNYSIIVTRRRIFVIGGEYKNSLNQRVLSDSIYEIRLSDQGRILFVKRRTDLESSLRSFYSNNKIPSRSTLIATSYNKFFIFGGISDFNTKDVTDVYVYGMVDHDTSDIVFINSSNLPYAVAQPAPLLTKTKLYLIGGITTDSSDYISTSDIVSFNLTVTADITTPVILSNLNLPSQFSYTLSSDSDLDSFNLDYTLHYNHFYLSLSNLYFIRGNINDQGELDSFISYYDISNFISSNSLSFDSLISFSFNNYLVILGSSKSTYETFSLIIKVNQFGLNPITNQTESRYIDFTDITIIRNNFPYIDFTGKKLIGMKKSLFLVGNKKNFIIEFNYMRSRGGIAYQSMSYGMNSFYTFFSDPDAQDVTMNKPHTNNTRLRLYDPYVFDPSLMKLPNTLDYDTDHDMTTFIISEREQYSY